MLAQNLARVHERIAQACQRAGRDPASVTLVCVTKGMPAGTVSELIRLGALDIGENRVQEARAKQIVLGSRLRVEGHHFEPRTSNLALIRWHLIGHLQRNKARDAVASFAMIHSVDSAALAQELQRQAARLNDECRLTSDEFTKRVEVLIQVNVSGEATKFGCAPEAALPLAKTICQLPALRLKGFMTIPPLVQNPEEARPYFRSLRLLRDHVSIELKQSSLVNQQSSLLLSMGMSGDFEVAIEEGAAFVRVGTAIVGTRGMGQGTGHE